MSILLRRHYSTYDPYKLSFDLELNPVFMHCIKYITRFRKKGKYRDLMAVKVSLDRYMEIIKQEPYILSKQALEHRRIKQDNSLFLEKYFKVNNCNFAQKAAISRIIDINSVYVVNDAQSIVNDCKRIIDRLIDKEYPLDHQRVLVV
jgi:hypothetical protein